MKTGQLKQAGFSFEEIASIGQGRQDIADGKVYSHDDVQAYARKELFAHAEMHA